MSLLAFILPVALAAVPSIDDPAHWRDRGEGTPVATWDAMEGEPFPSLERLTSWFNTGPLSWEDLRGHVVLVQHFATWRKPALRDLPEVVDLFLEHRGEGLVVLTIHSKREAEDFERLVIKMGVPHAVAIEGGGGFARKTGSKRLPTYHVVGRDGLVRVAGVSSEEGVLDQVVVAALAETWEAVTREAVTREIHYAPRIWMDPRPKPTPPLRVGPGGWPVLEDKALYARVDVRGRQAPAFGESIWLTPRVEVTGKPHLLLVWATYIGTCMPALNRMQELHQRFGPEFITLAVSEQAPDAYERGAKHPWGNRVQAAFDTRPDWTFASVLDGEQILKGALGVKGMPHVILVDSEGIVRWQGDPTSADHPLTDAVVARILAIDGLRSGAPQLRLERDGLRLTGAPCSLPGGLWFVPHELRAWSSSLLLGGPGDARPLAGLVACDDHGGASFALVLPQGLGPASLAWRGRRPTGYDGEMSWVGAR